MSSGDLVVVELLASHFRLFFAGKLDETEAPIAATEIDHQPQFVHSAHRLENRQKVVLEVVSGQFSWKIWGDLI